MSLRDGKSIRPGRWEDKTMVPKGEAVKYVNRTTVAGCCLSMRSSQDFLDEVIVLIN